MATKIYQSIVYEHYTMTFIIDGKRINVDFTNNYSGRKGRFTTPDPVIQDAIEKHPSYGKMFKLVETKDVESLFKPVTPQEVTNVPEVQEVMVKQIQEEVKQAEERIKEKEKEEIPETLVLSVDTVTNAQKAKDWIVKNFPGVVYRDVGTVPKIKDFMDKNHIKFPNWQ